MRQMDLVHLLLDMVPIQVAGLGGKQAVFGIRELGAGIAMAQGGVDCRGLV